MYDGFWWIGLIIEKDEEDVLVKFMHPHGPAHSFKWPNFEDKCWLPYNHILMKIDSPTTLTGRTYIITKEDNNKILQKIGKQS